MERKRWTSANLAKVAREQAQVAQDRTAPIVDQASTVGKLGPYAGHRAGKRKRGVSVTRKTPREHVAPKRYYMIDEHGNTLGSFNTLTYRKPE